MKRTILSLLVVGLFAGIGTSAIADDVGKAGTEPRGDVTAQRPAASVKQTDPAKADVAAQMSGTDGSKLAKDFVDNSSDQPRKTKDY